MADEVQVPEGGLRCAKEVIDQAAAVTHVLECMRNSILLNAGAIEPTEEQLGQFIKAGNTLAEVAAGIVKYVSGQ